MSELKQNYGALGMDLEQSLRQLKKGKLTYALNAMLEGSDGQFVNYQNEQGNELCVTFPEGYKVIGVYTIYEKNKVIYFLSNPDTGDSEIGQSDLEGCTYSTIVNASCLNFSIEHPILSAAHRIDNCSTQVFWVDGYNKDRWIDLDNLPYKEQVVDGACENVLLPTFDCNKMAMSPIFSIPQVVAKSIHSDGALLTGAYQFAVQYANASGQGYTAYYTVSNPVPIFSANNITLSFDTQVNKSIEVLISNLDSTGFYDYINVAVIKTINNASTVDLVGTYKISGTSQTIIYSGQNAGILAINDVVQRYPIYEKSNDITVVNDILVRSQLSSVERVNYQDIASNITVQWQTWRVPSTLDYSNELLATHLRGYMRDEVYAFDIVFLLDDGKETDKFHIPGRKPTSYDLEYIYNQDTINPVTGVCAEEEPLPRWKVYNTANVIGTENFCIEPPYINWNEGTAGISAYVGPDDSILFGPPDTSPSSCCYTYVVRNYSLEKIKVRYVNCSSGTESVLQVNPATKKADGTYTPTEVIVECALENAIFPESPTTLCQSAQYDCVEITKWGKPCNECSPVDPSTPTESKCCVGPYQFGEMSYWESEETYPCIAEIWGNLAGQKIRHHKFPDSAVTHIHDNIGNIYPIGIKIDIVEIEQLILNSKLTTEQKRKIVGFKIVRANRANNKSVVAKGLLRNVGKYTDNGATYFFPNYPFNDLRTDPFIQRSDSRFSTDSQSRYVFQSPDTSFYLPFLGNVLKLETAEYGKADAHFVQVKQHAKYQMYTLNIYLTAFAAGLTVATLSVILLGKPNWSAGIATYQTVLDILKKTTPFKNYAYQYNAVGNYNYYTPIQNTGDKQRLLDIFNYIIPGYPGVKDLYTINNFQRESSVYLRTTSPLPFVSDIPGVPVDNSRYTIGQVGCGETAKISQRDISAYYGSVKRGAPSQYGQIYSYDTVDTGFQEIFKLRTNAWRPTRYIFGGDIYINKFAFKSKMPFFIEDRVNVPDGVDVDYGDINNIGLPNYYLVTNVGGNPMYGSASSASFLSRIFNAPYAKLDCQSGVMYNKGYMYINAIGIPYFYCESEVNVDMRQAFNDREGNFYPNVGLGIPDQWLQPSIVPMSQDNSYYYNKTLSKQNKEVFFSFLPLDYSSEKCTTVYPFRAIYSEKTNTDPFSTLNNNWLIYKPSSYFDFPQNFGRLISLDGIDYRQVIARFENRMQKYNALLVAPTSTAQVYLGQPLFSSDTPPVDYAITDQGYAGTRHRFMLKTEYGLVTVDDKRGQVFLISGDGLKNLTNTESGVEQFFNKNLEVKLPKYFPEVPLDNTFNGVGITGVFDAKYNRLILTKLDYEPKLEGITYSNGKFYYNQNEVQLTDLTYFCNKSFTISYDFDYQSWISFHSYLPSYYIGSSNFFLSGIQGSTWKHLTPNNYCSFYGEQGQYIIEYPYAFEYFDEILQSVQDYSKTFQYNADGDWVEVNDAYFNKVILYNDQQCSGILKLHPKPKNNLNQYMKYPIYETDAKTILYTKSDNLYKINQFWSLVRDNKQPIFKKTCQALSYDKELNQANMNYSKMSFKKAPLRAKDLKCRYILDDRTDTRIVSQLSVIQTQKSYK